MKKKIVPAIKEGEFPPHTQTYIHVQCASMHLPLQAKGVNMQARFLTIWCCGLRQVDKNV